MTPTKELDPTTSAYQEAEKMIDQAISKMEGETHIEYGSTIERDSKPQRKSRLKRWLHRLRLKR